MPPEATSTAMEDSLERPRSVAPPPARSARRRRVDRLARVAIAGCGAVSIIVLFGIFTMLFVNAAQTFRGGIETGALTVEELAQLSPSEAAALRADQHQPPSLFGDFLFTLLWSPDNPHGSSYGVLAMTMSTFLVTLGSMLIAVPLGVAAAAWLAFHARGRVRELVKFGVELIAAVPSVVVGLVGITVVGPAIGWAFDVPGGLTVLNGAILLAVMALPTIISIAEDSLAAVPRSLIAGSLALGADRWQTLWHVVVPAARSGLFAAVMLGMGRAIGETMTVLMATGNVIALPTSPLDPARTMTATIAIELGEVAQGTTHYYALFAVGLLLFLITLGVNLAADAVQRRQERFLA